MYPAKYVEFFGPSTWRTMHAIAFTYGSDPEHPTPDEHKAAKAFFKSLRELIPCESCRLHYGEYLDRHPLKADNREQLARWVYDLHSDVNRRRGAPNVPYAEVVRDYTGMNHETATMMNAMSVTRRRKALADPHMGRPIFIAKGVMSELASGMSIFDSEEKIILFVIVGSLLVAAAYHFLFRISKEENDEAEAKRGGEVK